MSDEEMSGEEVGQEMGWGRNVRGRNVPGRTDYIPLKFLYIVHIS
jgi:hypothetical protein